MASEFLQMVVVVELRNPPERLHGSVTGIAAGQSLTLSNVWSLNHQTWHPQVVVDPANIVDISEAGKGPDFSLTSSSAPPPAPAPAPAQAPILAPASNPPTATTLPVLGDPAILAFKPRPGRPTSGPSQSRSPSRHAQPTAVENANIPPPPHAVLGVRIKRPSRNATPVATPPASEDGGGLGPGAVRAAAYAPYAPREPGPDAADTPGWNAAETTPAGRHAARQEETSRSRRRQRQQRGTRTSQANESVDLTPTERPKQAGRGKGWRETPMLQSTASFQPFKSLKKSGRQRQQPNQDNGWASEDVTDVQEMGDFDFEGSLAKFDKRTLFDQMRKEDQVDEADRLVTHNRRPQPGTAGGKNLHYSENVLDLPTTVAVPTRPAQAKEPQAVSQDFWNSEADDAAAGAGPGGAGGGERLSGRELGSRQNSRRGESKVSATRRSQSRKASAGAGAVGQGPSSRVNSVAGTQGFYLLPSNRRVDTVSALQMLNLENIAHNELGLTEDMMAENAGRGLAEVTLAALADPAVKIHTGAAGSNHTHSPSAVPNTNMPAATIVVLAGNNKSGARAVAGARHLRNKGANVLVCVVGIERGERELLEDFRQQVRLYRNFGGRIYSKSELFEYLRKAAIPTLTIDTPRSAVAAKPPAVTLIVDALLGLAVSFDELRTGDQATVYELIEWANRNEAFVLAVDVPTGIDPSSGHVSIIDGAGLYVWPRYVVALGAPKRGLLEAIIAAETDDAAAPGVTLSDDPARDWRLFVVDIGLGAAVFKKAGTKFRRGIDFDGGWVLEMRYQGLTTDEGSA
ncbi:yjef n-terminal domain containing protein [Niveomyces insectorum RCEF 264]|uniref:Enhancer of mRNA-decapping protein 3 n=1 Tax=Niveomyces insectorum RCEF 264 TaxID=1081102 RepID=A0A167TDY6_9HYPO|nr:yjef n-terminal domain containing protein [Niveomyces insectorum RCEF 264]